MHFWKRDPPPPKLQCQQMTVTYSRKATQKENDLTRQTRCQREGEKIKTEGRVLQLREGTIKSDEKGKDGDIKKMEDKKINRKKQVSDLMTMQIY